MPARKAALGAALVALGESIFRPPAIALSQTAVNPPWQEALWANVVSALESGNWPEAETGAREVLCADSGFTAALAALAISLEDQGKRTTAREAYERVVSRRPGAAASSPGIPPPEASISVSKKKPG